MKICQKLIDNVNTMKRTAPNPWINCGEEFLIYKTVSQSIGCQFIKSDFIQ